MTTNTSSANGGTATTMRVNPYVAGLVGAGLVAAAFVGFAGSGQGDSGAAPKHLKDGTSVVQVDGRTWGAPKHLSPTAKAKPAGTVVAAPPLSPNPRGTKWF